MLKHSKICIRFFIVGINVKEPDGWHFLPALNLLECISLTYENLKKLNYSCLSTLEFFYVFYLGLIIFHSNLLVAHMLVRAIVVIAGRGGDRGFGDVHAEMKRCRLCHG